MASMRAAHETSTKCVRPCLRKADVCMLVSIGVLEGVMACCFGGSAWAAAGWAAAVWSAAFRQAAVWVR
eukprot:265061-Chlamydomonas_euryale.AAC.2